ncbi:RNA-binding protein [Leptospira wolffii]|uniref:RNA recognition motif domain-containing protein n=1 Tax=Leptospira wolffii TaxID=409998 RepID=UPI001084896F|nr:RNA-binding protein [Leptospira wolffii]TGK59487.1 RNA-binding protein [Leptospira wolffii]TGK71130.1 RNA-binding protein [Leptospira wolffii]TGK77698.1 RNA-binding protein [Leptospira wolffii]TGL29592.1 RNA-binding protein [Leptospira wolffii]
MSSKLFVGGLSWSTTDLTLRQVFETHGAIQEANIVIDRETGRSRGFGFVTFVDQYSAETAISALNGKDLDGRNIVVSVAEDKARSDRNRNSNRKFRQDRW